MADYSAELEAGMLEADAAFAEAEKLGLDPFSDEFLHRNDPIPEGGNILPFKRKGERDG